MLKKKLCLLCFTAIMATLGEGTDPPEQNEGGKDNHNLGTKEPLIILSELRATVSQMLKEAGQPKEASSRSQATPTLLSLVSVGIYSPLVDCVAEMTELPL